jgi:hypothetical protein
MSCVLFSQGQVEANDIAHDNYYQSQKIKDSLAIELIKINKNDSTFIKRFEASEKLWNMFVDDQFKLKFPEYESWETRRAIYGSQFDMLYFQFMKLYCDLRISTLYDLFEE